MFLSKQTVGGCMFQEVFLSELGVPGGARKCCYSNNNQQSVRILCIESITCNGIAEEIQFPGILNDPTQRWARIEIIFFPYCSKYGSW